MRILFVSNNYTPYSSGIVSSIDATIAELKKNGHSVALITLDFLGKKQIDPEWVYRIPSLIRFGWHKNYMVIPWRPAFHLKKWIHEIKPDVIHIHHPFLLGPIALRIAKQMGIKTIFTYHTQYEHYVHYIPILGRLLKPVIAQLVTRFCRKVDHIIAPSRGIKDALYEDGISHVTVIPSSLRSIFLKQSFRYKQYKEPITLLYVGRLAQEKNIPFLLEVVAMLPDFYHFILAGYGPDSVYLQHYAYTHLKLSRERVRFHIKPDRDIILHYYHAAHLFLFASQTDTQGLVLAESMGCATPVIALDGIGQRDSITNGVNGFIVHSVHEMNEVIQTISPSQYPQLQRGAYAKAQQYDASALVKRVLALYQ